MEVCVRCHEITKVDSINSLCEPCYYNKCPVCHDDELPSDMHDNTECEICNRIVCNNCSIDKKRCIQCE